MAENLLLLPHKCGKRQLSLSDVLKISFPLLHIIELLQGSQCITINGLSHVHLHLSGWDLTNRHWVKYVCYYVHRLLRSTLSFSMCFSLSSGLFRGMTDHWKEPQFPKHLMEESFSPARNNYMNKIWATKVLESIYHKR